MMYKTIFSAVGITVIAAFFSIGCGGGGGSSGSRPSGLVGNWIDCDETTGNMELFKDGTGIWGGNTISWKIENKRFVTLSSDKGMSCDYKLSDGVLTLIIDDRDSTTFVKKGTNTYAQKAFERGKKAYEDDDYDKAIFELSLVIRINPNFAEAYKYRGDAYKDKSGYSNSNKAVADYTRAIQLNPKDYTLYLDRAVVYAGIDDDKAIADVTEAIRLNPKDGTTYLMRGQLYVGKDDQKALADFESAFKIDQSCKEPKACLEEFKKLGGIR